MIKTEAIIANLIYRLYRENKEKELNCLVVRLKRSGRLNLLKKALPILQEFDNEEKDILTGQLESAFDFQEINLLEKFLGKKIRLDRKKINNKLILGGVFRSKNLEVDFSLRDLIRRWMT